MMKFKIVTIALFILFSVILVSYTTSFRTFQQFSIGVPNEVDVVPGSEVVVNGTILNEGLWMLHDFNLTLSGLPKEYQYAISPSHFNDVRIIHEWNPQQGDYRGTENFSLRILIPDDASGVYLVNVTGQEFRSWRMVANSSIFILKVKSQSFANFTLSDIAVPETILESQPFDISFNVMNTGTTAGDINLAINVPEGWEISESTKTLTVGSGETVPVDLTVTPTNASGQIVVSGEYSYQGTIVNISKSSLIIIPESIPSEGGIPTGFSIILKEISPYLIILSIVFLAIIIWNLWRIYKFRAERGKEEKMPKKAVENTCESAGIVS